MRVTKFAVVGVLAAIGAAACSSGPQTPDEFRVVRKAPLTVPPEYNLRPPAPGESRPQELAPDAEARIAVFGRDIGASASAGEQALVAAAGGSAVDSRVRATVDYETSQTLKKSRGFADKVLSFGKDEAATAEQIAADALAVEEVTGGDPVVIRRRSSGKLPGL